MPQDTEGAYDRFCVSHEVAALFLSLPLYCYNQSEACGIWIDTYYGERGLMIPLGRAKQL